MRKPAILVTGASGEIGHGLIERFKSSGRALVTLDVQPLGAGLSADVQREIVGSVLDASVLQRVLAEYEVDLIFHLAALLSTRSEFSPTAAHDVNVSGTLSLLEFAEQQAASHGRPVVFLYPSSIAVYGLPTLEAKARAGAVREDQWTEPTTMYGCNKFYCEHLGRYYARHYKQLSAEHPRGGVDFRALRFPGLISAATRPAGGTSDYAPEMVHAAAARAPYRCFVRPDTRIPFMAMPDAVEALVTLAEARRLALTRIAYNVRAFSASAAEMRAEVLRTFPGSQIDYHVDPKRQAIVDSWPADVDDSAARADWGFTPLFGVERTFHEYLPKAIATV